MSQVPWKQQIDFSECVCSPEHVCLFIYLGGRFLYSETPKQIFYFSLLTPSLSFCLSHNHYTALLSHKMSMLLLPQHLIMGKDSKRSLRWCSSSSCIISPGGAEQSQGRTARLLFSLLPWPRLTTRSLNLTPTNRDLLVNLRVGHASHGGMWFLWAASPWQQGEFSAAVCSGDLMIAISCPPRAAALFTDLWNLQHANTLEISVTPVAPGC